MKIWHLPIEPYETRYTADWVQEFEKEFTNANVEFETIFGVPTVNTLKPGTVLDCCGTNIYKMSQLSKLLQKINDGEVKDNDCILFADMWFPGLESLFYVRDLSKINFKIYGILHAGTWDKHDFTSQAGMGKWAKHIETSWITNVDKVFVATNFHKQLIEEYIPEAKGCITVTGIPFYSNKLSDNYDTSNKRDIVVFPHRCVPEKQPELFDQLSKQLPQFTFIKTLDICKNRQQYFELLAKSKYMVSFANQETFGYSTVESMALGCKVFVPDKLSYKETVPQEDRYDITDSWVDQVKNMIMEYEQNYTTPDYSPCLQKWQSSILNMINVMKGDNNVI